MTRRPNHSDELGPIAAWLTAIATTALATAIAIGLGAGGASPEVTAPIAGGLALSLAVGLVIGSRRVAGAALVLGGATTAAGVALGAPMPAVPAGAALLLASEASTDALLRRGRSSLGRGMRGRLVGRTGFVVGVGAAVATLLAAGETPLDGRSVALETVAVTLAVAVIGAAAVMAHRRLRPPAGPAEVS